MVGDSPYGYDVTSRQGVQRDYLSRLLGLLPGGEKGRECGVSTVDQTDIRGLGTA